MRKIFAGLGIFFAITAYAFTEVDRQELVARNAVKNGGFENGLGNWSVLNGTISTTSNNPGAISFGNASAILTPNGSAPATFKTNDFVLSGGLYNNTCLGRISYRGNASRYAFSILADTGATIFGSVLNNNSNYARTSMSFPCPTQTIGAGKVRAQVVSYGKDTNSVLIDDVFFGEDTTTVNQPAAVWAGSHTDLAGGCNWVSNGTGFVDPTASASCQALEIYNRGMGTVTSTSIALGSAATRSPQIEFTPPRTGVYFVHVTLISLVTTGFGQFQLVDGNNVALGVNAVAQNTSPQTYVLSGFLPVTSLTQKTLKIRIQASGGGANATLGSAGITLETNTEIIHWDITEIK